MQQIASEFILHKMSHSCRFHSCNTFISEVVSIFILIDVYDCQVDFLFINKHKNILYFNYIYVN